MKSAYELAMERLSKENPEHGSSLSESQKQALAEVDRSYDAKVAEREIFLQAKIEAAKADERAALETQLQRERVRLNEEREQAKEAVRKG